MKLVLAIIPEHSTSTVTSSLTKGGFFVTRLATTGGFLMTSNTTLLIGSDEDKIPAIRDILKENCTSESQISPSLSDFGKGLSDADAITAGGGIMFVLNVEKFEKI